MQYFNGIVESPDKAVLRIDDIGGPHSHTNYPWGWAQCGNSPFRWYKQNTHEGGVHVPMVMHWPWRMSVINWDGEVSTCCGSFEQADDMGNVFEHGFKKIWNGEKYRNARRSFKHKLTDEQSKDNPCANCPGFML